ncbi:MAG TPA: polyprenyl diphosphate synthase [Candidatus Pacearchaeota archaeon]|nr:polyprenyl diphosphate synthase [Candidatus Pacearchaeota archaeon]HOK94229.1 polyprenyl diphosphate synthase [Candidatus Pacearchaeota archaeon]HPO75343.1 polyprenyl diphosphate synthase [Candidatus Pacearchaeota archaeon]
MENAPQHVAVIPDGNRRWARKRGFQPWVGHQAGTKSLEKVLEKALELKIPYFTFWGASFDNLTERPKKEIEFLFKIYAEQFKRIAKDKRVHQNKVKVSVLGRWKEILPKETQQAIKKAVEATKDYNNYFLTFLLAYNGTDEMRTAIQKIADEARNKVVKVTDKLIKDSLWTKDLPAVDLVIRTGCEKDPHMSAGFMMWDTAYSQYYFTETFFPDFGPKEFEGIINDFVKRERRMGK